MMQRFIVGRSLMFCLAFLLSGCLGQSQEQAVAAPSSREDSLRRFLQAYLRRDLFRRGGTDVRYSVAFADLNGDGKDEAVVYLRGGGFCGSGGCNTLVFTPEDASYRVVGDITITRPPIRMLSRSSHGWRNLVVWVGGGGAQSGEAELLFDGKRYPMSPSMPFTRRLEEEMPGEVLIPGTAAGEGKPLELRASPSLLAEASLEEVLQDYMRRIYFSAGPPDAGYFEAFADLNGDGKNEAIVYLTGPRWWRGTLVFTPEASSYRLIGELRVAQPPIRVLSRSSHGWRNLSVWVEAGGSIPTSHSAEIPFDGKTYTRSPAKPTARRLEVETPGEVLIPGTVADELGNPLFPAEIEAGSVYLQRVLPSPSPHQ